MGNRRKTAAARTAQFYRNAQSRMRIVLPRRRRNGDWVRNEGPYNLPYGPLDKHSHTGVLALKKNRERSHRDYSRPGFTPCELHPTYTGKGAPRSKAKTCTCRSIYEAVRA